MIRTNRITLRKQNAVNSLISKNIKHQIIWTSLLPSTYSI